MGEKSELHVPTQVKQITAWKNFLKKFANTEGIMQWHMHSLIIDIIIYFLAEANVAFKKGGLVQYNRAASTKYSELSMSEKKKLSEEVMEPRPMKKREIQTAGKKIFAKIQKHVRKFLFAFDKLPAL